MSCTTFHHFFGSSLFCQFYLPFHFVLDNSPNSEFSVSSAISSLSDIVTLCHPLFPSIQHNYQDTLFQIKGNFCFKRISSISCYDNTILLKMSVWKTMHMPLRDKMVNLKSVKALILFCSALKTIKSLIFPDQLINSVWSQREYQQRFYGARKLILNDVKKNEHTRIVKKILKKNQERELL